MVSSPINGAPQAAPAAKPTSNSFAASGNHFPYSSAQIIAFLAKIREGASGVTIRPVTQTPQPTQTEPPAIERTALSINPQIDPTAYKAPVQQLARNELVLSVLLDDPAARALLSQIIKDQTMKGATANVA